MKKKIVLVTEFINPPYDEGIKKTAFKIYKELKIHYEVRVICRHGFDHEDIHVVKTNKLFYSGRVKRVLKEFEPHLLLYLPFQSTTFASYVRFMILRRLYDRPKAVLFALQPKPIKRWQRFFLGYLKPPFAVTPSLTLAEFWTKNEIKNTIVPLSTDISVFKPIDFNSKQRLKKRYALDHCEYIVSHMGHLNEKRNLKSLIPLQKSGIQVVVVTSTSSPKSDTLNSDIKQELENEGIIVFDQYMECIEEIYQISDTYVFPVIDENASIGMPLSILEARSCGIPVVSTDYGSIRYFFDYDNGAIRYSSVDNFLENCNYFLNSGKSFNDSNVRIINDKFIEVIDDYIL